jgi:TolB-like protein
LFSLSIGAFAVERKLTAMLAADVVGYSRLLEQDEGGTLAALWERRKRILNPLVALHKGRIVKVMGDGVLVEFASAVNAVQCAVELQQKMADANTGLNEERAILLRVAVNLGDVAVEDGDLYGEGVNIAARLEEITSPGAIYISGTVYDQLKGKLNLEYEDLGRLQLKNISEPVRVYRVGRNQIGTLKRPALTLPEKPSIAVLPFQNMSGEVDQEYFADGIVEEIITALSRFRHLFVIARNSSFTYKGRAVDVKQIGRELGVRYVLEGGVRRAGDRVRITGQLIDATNGAHLWADRLEGTLQDIFDLQDQVTAHVVGAIAPRLEQAEIERAQRKPTGSLDAYDYYLRGVAAVHRWTREGNEEAISMFARAVALDLGFGSAYGMAARCYSQRKVCGWITDRGREIAEAEKMARRAAELGRDDAVALTGAGIALGYVVGDLDTGIALIERALQLNPNLAWAWLFAGWLKVWLGEPEIALEHLARAMRLSPHDPQFFNMQAACASAHFFAGRYSEGSQWAEMAMRDNPHHLMAASTAAASHALAGRLSEAQRALARLREIDPALRVSNLDAFVPLRRPEDLARLAEGLRKAGLPE